MGFGADDQWATEAKSGNNRYPGPKKEKGTSPDLTESSGSQGSQP